MQIFVFLVITCIGEAGLITVGNCYEIIFTEEITNLVSPGANQHSCKCLSYSGNNSTIHKLKVTRF